MDPLVTAGIISGASALLGSGGQAVAQGKMNRKSRAWNEKMMHRQRDWAMSDYDRINQYNSPAQQMERYKQAGLNPHLIYGQQNEGTTVRGVSTAQWNPDTPDIKGIGNAVGGSILNYIDLKQRSAAIELTKESARTQIADQALKAAQTANTATTTARSKFDLDLASELRNTSVQMQQALLKERQQSIGIQATDSGIRQEDLKLRQQDQVLKTALNASSISEARQRIAESMNRIDMSEYDKRAAAVKLETLKNEHAVSALDAELARRGVRPGDSVYEQYMKKFVEWIFDSKQKIDQGKTITERLKKLWEILP